jgi:transcriptional regulator with XRE-family HTH domain
MLPGVTVTVSGHDLVQSHDCATQGCDEEATVQLGSLWYCRHHAGPIPKDTAREDVRNAVTNFGSSKESSQAAKVPSTNGATPADRRELARRLRDQGATRTAIAQELGVSLSTVGNYLNGTTRNPQALADLPEPRNPTHVSDLPEPAAKPNGQSFEFRAAALVELGRRVDAARAGLEPAQAAYEEACRRWREAVERLPLDTRLLPNAVAQDVTTGGPEGGLTGETPAPTELPATG